MASSLGLDGGFGHVMKIFIGVSFSLDGVFQGKWLCLFGFLSLDFISH